MTLIDFFHSNGSRDEYPIAALRNTDMNLIGSKTSTVWLSRESLDAHKRKHPEIGIEDYAKTQKIIDNGEIYKQGSKRFVILHVDGAVYRAAVKVTAEGEKTYLLSLFKTTEHLADIQVRNKFELARRASKG